MNALRQEILPPSGVEHAVSLNLTPSTRRALANPSSSAPVLGVVSNLVVARQNLLRVFEVRVEVAPLPTQAQVLADEQGKARRGTEAVEGEIEMDAGGEGFSAGQLARHGPRTVTKLYLVRQHHLHGTVTGLARVQTTATLEDRLDRLLVSFKDAKIALLEWSEPVHDLNTVSIHSYERAPQLMSFDLTRALHELRVDPDSRCAVLTLPQDALAVLPFYESVSKSNTRDVPYAPSFVLSLPEVDNDMRNIIDIAFLNGFNNPTLAVLFQTQQTWTGRLTEFKDTVKLRIITLDLVTRTYPIITSVDNLPYDCFKLVPCPAALGGVVVLAGNALLHVDQSGKSVGVAMNGWTPRATDFPMAPPERDDKLEGSHAVFVSERTFLLVSRDGAIVPVEIQVGGRLITKLEVGERLAQTTIPSSLCTVNPELVLVTHDEEDIVPGKSAGSNGTNGASHGATYDDPMDSDDEDLYGGADMMVTSTSGTVVGGHATTVEKRRVLRLALADSLYGHGSISDMVFVLARNGERPVPDLLASVGTGHLGGFALFQRDMPSRVKRKLHKLSGNGGVWSFPVRRAMKVAGMNIERPSGPGTDWDTVVVSSDTFPSPGLSRVAIRDSRDDAEILARSASVTVGAGPFFQRTAILQVVTNAIRVLEADGSERQVIKDVDGATPRAPIISCSISDPFVAIVREDGTLGLFVGKTGKGKLRRKDMSSLGDKSSRYLAASFYQDNSGIFQMGSPSESRKGKEKAQESTTIEATIDEGRGTQWLVLCRPEGVLEIWTLPELTIVFSCSNMSSIPPVLADSLEPATPSPEQDPPRTPENLDIEEIIIAPIGESSPRPHLLVLLRSGYIAVYDTIPVEAPFGTNGRETALLVAFVRVFSRAVDVAPADKAENKRGPPAVRHLVPFTTSFSGVFLTGNRPAWIYFACSLSSCQWCSLQCVGHPHSGHSCRTATRLSSSRQTGHGAMSLIARDLCWRTDPDTWATLDGFEFPFNEFINTVRTVSLETVSTEAGSKDYIAVGTTVFRGEDLAVKGATYIFEVTEVVSDGQTRRFKLRLQCRDEAKGPVSALCGINGYLVSSMGQKVFVRAFDLNERLVGVAFMDVGVYVTSLRTLKNLLLIGDAVKSVWFVAFQEDPFKLLLVGKDFMRASLTSAEFFFGFGEMAIVTTDEQSVLRVFKYDPLHAESHDGQRLLCQTEFFAQAETQAVVTIMRRPRDDDLVTPQSKLLYGGCDGSLTALVPVEEAVFKRLHLLQGQMTRNVQHVAGLNPKAFRSVRNEFVARPLTKGVVDGNLLARLEDLSIPRQVEFTKQIGTSREVILADWIALNTAW
ncbi:hypothetical protein EXIGLDRAFT_712088 [Exidia glandulosa HHB12029]|uniref:Cleavage/polyadenylation specificity factor A subunit C-terminal domain-containing protein n=1 Tax=Exidia glandulosa HHB12029 TaxID=1314781 RepID=A0A165EBQ2_EXIGL|nr:hypothetical protein EXIGLDRAFT_712088 [Exidia glandulosa HHB12029]